MKKGDQKEPEKRRFNEKVQDKLNNTKK